MTDEATVYGYIKKNADSNPQTNYLHHSVNRQMIKALPSMDYSALLNQEFFSTPFIQHHDETMMASVIHFAKSYRGVEYEWSSWIAEFEALLQKMYWHSVVVHLETELSGIHTFTWHSDAEIHAPNQSPLDIRCEWQHELGIAPRYA